METKKSDEVETGCECAGIAVSGAKVTGHQWSGWPGAFCLRCGSGQVLEIALADGWFSCGPGEPDVWKSEEHKELVHLCDGFCYADMTPIEATEHKDKIKDLVKKLGV
jgi:hypothetical protein